MSKSNLELLLDRLEELLSRIPALEQYENRTILLKGLPSGPVKSIKRGDSHQADLHSILQSVVMWEKLKSGEYALNLVIDNAVGMVKGLELEDTLNNIKEKFLSLKTGQLITPTDHIPFTNREDEIARIMSSFSPPYYLLDAPAGYGKTALLKEVARRFKERRDWRCAYLIIQEDMTLADISSALARKLHITAINPDLPWGYQLGGALRNQWEKDPKDGLLLLFDIENPKLQVMRLLLEELIPAIQESLRVLEFFWESHNRFRVVLSGRYIAAVSRQVKTAPLNPKELYLLPFTYDVIQESATKYLVGHKDELIRELSAYLLHLTGGHPGCLAQSLRMYREAGIAPNKFIEIMGPVIWDEIVSETIKGINSEVLEIFSEFDEIVKDLSIFRYWDHEILKYILEKDGSLEMNEYRLAEILVDTYLFSWQDRLLKDDIIRRLMALWVQHEEPKEFTSLCNDAMEMCLKRLTDPRVQRPEMWVVEYLFQSLHRHANRIQSKEERRIVSEAFFNENLPRALCAFLEDREVASEAQPAELAALIQVMDADWEFRFTVNYYMRERQYTGDQYTKLQKKAYEFLHMEPQRWKRL
jgi:hypothetical protein